MIHRLQCRLRFLLRLLARGLRVVGNDSDPLAVRSDLVPGYVDGNLSILSVGLRGRLQINRRVQADF